MKKALMLSLLLMFSGIVLGYHVCIIPEGDIYHIGNNPGGYTYDVAVGYPSWETTFVLDTALVVEDAVLYFDTYGLGRLGSGIEINGIYIGDLGEIAGDYSSPANNVWINDKQIIVPMAALLISTDNTHTFKLWVDDQPNGDPDDILFRNVCLENVPEPATLSLLAVGGLALLGKRK